MFHMVTDQNSKTSKIAFPVLCIIELLDTCSGSRSLISLAV